MKRNRISVVVAAALMSIGGLTVNSQELIIPPITITGLAHRPPSTNQLSPPTITEWATIAEFTGFTATLTGSELIVTSFQAPAGQMFVFHAPPEGFGNITLALTATWRDVGSSPSIPILSPMSFAPVFANLSGVQPTLLSSVNGIGNLGDRVGFQNTFSVEPGTMFTGVQLFAQYASSIPSPMERTFTPGSANFRAYAYSSGIWTDGVIMTLEAIPEPSTFALLSLGGSACCPAF